MSTTSSVRGGPSSDSPAQAACRKVCQAEDEGLAAALREEQAVAVGDIHSRLGALEEQTGEVEAKLAELQGEPDADEANERLEAFQSLTEAVTEVRKQLTEQQDKLEKLAEPDALMDETVRQLRQELNGVLEREGALRRASLGGDVNVASQDAALTDPIRPLENPQAQASTPQRQVKFEDTPQESSVNKSGGNSACQSRCCRPASKRKGAEDSSDDEAFPDYDDGGIDTTDDEAEGRFAPVPFHEREKGPKYRNLESLKAADPRFDRYLSYRFYRLSDTSQFRNFKKTGEVRALTKRLFSMLGDEGFDGEDKIVVLDFLVRYSEECEALGMSEAQALIILPSFLKGNAKKLYATARRGGINSWCEAVQWLLRTYAKSQVIRDGVIAFRNCQQKPDEDEATFGDRVRFAAYRCGNVFTEIERVGVFVDGLLPTTRTLVSRHKEATPRDKLLFDDIVSYAQDEGEAYRASKAVKGSSRNILPIEQADSSDPSLQGLNEDEAEMFGLIPDDSLYSSELPSTVDEGGLVLYGERPVQNRVPAPRLSYENSFTRNARPGWGSRPRGGRPYIAARQALTRLICYICYAIGHMASQCTCGLRDMERVKRNFEALTREEQANVPRRAYERALAYLADKPAPSMAAPNPPPVPHAVAQAAMQASPPPQEPSAQALTAEEPKSKN